MLAITAVTSAMASAPAGTAGCNAYYGQQREACINKSVGDMDARVRKIYAGNKVTLTTAKEIPAEERKSASKQINEFEAKCGVNASKCGWVIINEFNQGMARHYNVYFKKK